VKIACLSSWLLKYKYLFGADAEDGIADFGGPLEHAQTRRASESKSHDGGTCVAQARSQAASDRALHGFPMTRTSRAKRPTSLACISTRRPTPRCSRWTKKQPFKPWIARTRCSLFLPDEPSATALNTPSRHFVALCRVQHPDRRGAGKNCGTPYLSRIRCVSFRYCDPSTSRQRDPCDRR
jgi:hypothetical protein